MVKMFDKAPQCLSKTSCFNNEPPLEETSILTSGFAFPKWMRGITFVVGFLILAIGMAKLFSMKIKGLMLMFPYVLVGIVCLSMGGINNAMSISSEGVIYARTVWGKKRQEVLPWETVQSVAILRKKNLFYARFFKEDGKGWQIPFRSDQWEIFQCIVNKYRPDLTIEDKTKV